VARASANEKGYSVAEEQPSRRSIRRNELFASAKKAFDILIIETVSRTMAETRSPITFGFAALPHAGLAQGP
jgi:hypothetical protein